MTGIARHRARDPAGRDWPACRSDWPGPSCGPSPVDCERRPLRLPVTVQRLSLGRPGRGSRPWPSDSVTRNFTESSFKLSRARSVRSARWPPHWQATLEKSPSCITEFRVRLYPARRRRPAGPAAAAARSPGPGRAACQWQAGRAPSSGRPGPGAGPPGRRLRTEPGPTGARGLDSNSVLSPDSQLLTTETDIFVKSHFSEK